MKDNVVYAIESGEYSDYSIHGIFSTKDKAQAFMDKANTNYDCFSIKEYQLDMLMPTDKVPYKLDFENDEIDKVNVVVDEYCVSYCDRDAILPYVRSDESYFCRIFLWAKDTQSAIKIARERYSKAKALNWSTLYSGKIIGFYTQEKIE